ncbi:SHC SH2 domain-binding protein 1 homolog A [Centruroides vittatus]|uniref:SHC SH2 domain-binding protein 1 homolog A n=1 Tax=Centruroides vittatus TaxID=120091 RepID=UPI0035106EDD
METSVSSKVPSVYKVRLEYSTFDELLTVYDEEILKDVYTSGVEAAMIDYITRTIEPVGWSAVWRPQKYSGLSLDYDFIVEVKDVSLQKLEAEVKILSALNSSKEEEISNLNCISELENLMKLKSFNVPLIELYPISEGDDDELYLKTAVAIEHVRFFYKYIWRPWDDDDDDYKFVEKYLKTRLKFFFDVKNKVVTEDVIESANEILTEGFEIKQELERLRNNMNVSDSESELREEDVVETLQLQTKFEELQKKMEMLENPIIRTLVIKKDLYQKSYIENQDQLDPVTHIVGKKFDKTSLQNLPVDSSTILEFHHCLPSAIANSHSGDHILILPGNYKCKGLGWFDESITIEGFGKKEDIVLEGVDNGTIFINVAAPVVSLSNLTILSREEVMSIVVVHSGQLKLFDCIIDGSKAKNCLNVLSKAQTIATDCIFKNSNDDGIQINCSTTLILQKCTVKECGQSGIKIDGEDVTDSATNTIFSLEETVISKNRYGITINNLLGNAPPKNEENDDDYLPLLQSIKWLTPLIEKSEIIENSLGTVILCNMQHPTYELTLSDRSPGPSSDDIVSTMAWPLDSSGSSEEVFNS